MKMKNSKFISIVSFLAVILIIAGCRAKEKPSEEIEEIADTGIISVSSEPSQAQVYIDGELKGETPLTLYNVPVGAYSLIVKKEGYADFEKAVGVKVGRTEEVEAVLAQPAAAEKQKPADAPKPESAPEPMPDSSKIKLSSFAMYYDFDNIQFTEIRTSGSDLFSGKYDAYIDFTALAPAKIRALNKPIKDVKKEDCIIGDAAVATLYSGQSLCVQTAEGTLAAVGGSWQASPTELEWKLLS